jgi:hypothetical protein
MALSSESRDRILAKLRAGGLPRKGLTKMYAGYGRGYRCTACDRTITPYDIEYAMDSGGGVSYRMHSDCGALWQAESEQRDGSSTSAEMAADGHEPTR